MRLTSHFILQADRLLTFKGSESKHSIRMMLNRLGSPTLWQEFSLRGSKGKKRVFVGTPCFNLVIGTSYSVTSLSLSFVINTCECQASRNFRVTLKELQALGAWLTYIFIWLFISLDKTCGN